MKIELSNSLLDNLDMSYYQDKCPDFDSYYHIFNKKSGEAHYRLLAYLSLLFKKCVISDIGTNKGLSALCLGFNSSNIVLSFDQKERIFFLELAMPFQKEPGMRIGYYDNINFIIGNFFHFFDYIKYSSLILLDIDHSGITELKLLEDLIDNSYKGLLLIDDIHHNKEMQDFWSSINLTKYDITKYGNQSGTGLVDFSNTLELIQL